MWGTLDSDLKNFYIPLKSDSKVNPDPYKYLLKFTTEHLTVADSPTKLCFDLSSDDTIDLEMK